MGFKIKLPKPKAIVKIAAKATTPTGIASMAATTVLGKSNPVSQALNKVDSVTNLATIAQNPSAALANIKDASTALRMATNVANNPMIQVAATVGATAFAGPAGAAAVKTATAGLNTANTLVNAKGSLGNTLINAFPVGTGAYPQPMIDQSGLQNVGQTWTETPVGAEPKKGLLESLPKWAIPAGLAGAGIAAYFMFGKKGRRKRR